jgi:hypothetical protein
MDGRSFVEEPASKNLRRRIVAAVEEGTPRRVAAARLSVREICAIKFMQRWQKTGIVAPVRMGAGRKALFEGHEVQTGFSPACSRAQGRKHPDERRGARRQPSRRNAP